MGTTCLKVNIPFKVANRIRCSRNQTNDHFLTIEFLVCRTDGNWRICESEDGCFGFWWRGSNRKERNKEEESCEVMGNKFRKDKEILGWISGTVYWFPRSMDLCHNLEKLRRSICQKENVVFAWTTKEGGEDGEAKVTTQTEEITTITRFWKALKITFQIIASPSWSSSKDCGIVIRVIGKLKPSKSSWKEKEKIPNCNYCF